MTPTKYHGLILLEDGREYGVGSCYDMSGWPRLSKLVNGLRDSNVSVVNSAENRKVLTELFSSAPSVVYDNDLDFVSALLTEAEMDLFMEILVAKHEGFLPGLVLCRSSKT